MSEDNKNQAPESQYSPGDTHETPAVNPPVSAKSRSKKRKAAPSRKPALPAKKAPAPKVSQKDKKPIDETGDELKYASHSAIYSITIAVVYIVLVLMASAVASFFIISIGNDVFALTKDERAAEIKLDLYPTVIDVSNALADEGIINYPAIFKIYARYKLDPGEDFIPGTYSVSSLQNYDSLISSFLEQTDDRRIVTVTIPEGYTVDEIIQLFLNEGIGTKDGFIDAIANGVYDYEFVKRLEASPLPEGRKYKFEGYLFPDTYYFYADWDEELIINKLLAGFNAKFKEEYYAYIDSMGLTVDQCVAIASIIQREAYFNSDMELISGVIHNRLNNPSTYPKLECDSTVIYALGAHKADLTQTDLDIDNPYNTYIYNGLPPSAICNPGTDAIYTAMRPATSDYYYFVSRSNGEMIYAKTYKDHLKNVAEVRAEKE